MSTEVKYLVEEKNHELDVFLILKILKKNFLFLFITFILFAIISSAYVFTRPNEYYASFPIKMNTYVSSSIINDLKNSSKFSDLELKEIVKLSDEELKHLNFIHISNIIETELKHTATINISTSEASYTEPILNKLILWAENNPGVIKIMENRESKIDLLISKIDEQLLEIKGLKDKMLSGKSNSEANQFSFTGEFNIYNTKIQLTEEKEYLKALNLEGQRFIPRDSKNKSVVVPLFFAFTISFLIALFLTIILRFNRVD